MLKYDRIDIAEGIDINKTDASKKCKMNKSILNETVGS